MTTFCTYPEPTPFSDWPDCKLELHCCKGTVVVPVRLLAARHGDLTFARVLSRLRCDRCGDRPAEVYLCAGHRRHSGGASADWVIELLRAGDGV
jgi:hypothetical protein